MQGINEQRKHTQERARTHVHSPIRLEGRVGSFDGNLERVSMDASKQAGNAILMCVTIRHLIKKPLISHCIIHLCLCDPPKLFLVLKAGFSLFVMLSVQPPHL